MSLSILIPIPISSSVGRSNDWWPTGWPYHGHRPFLPASLRENLDPWFCPPYLLQRFDSSQDMGIFVV